MSITAPLNSSSPENGIDAYVSPVGSIRDLVPGRIGQGVVYSGSGLLDALGDGTVAAVSTSAAWPGGGLIVLALSAGTFAGEYVYHAGALTPMVYVGQQVQAGDSLANLGAGSSVELGFAAGPGGQTLASALRQNGIQTGQSSDPGGVQSTAGRSFNALMVALNVPAAGTGSGPRSTGPGMPNTWPSVGAARLVSQRYAPQSVVAVEIPTDTSTPGPMSLGNLPTHVLFTPTFSS